MDGGNPSYSGQAQMFRGETLFGHVFAPHFRGGLEWRPQPRLGLGFFVNYDHFNKKGKAKGTGGEIDIFEVNKFSIEPTFALYF